MIGRSALIDRTAALAILAVLASLVVSQVIAPPIRTYRDMSDELASKKLLIERASADIERRKRETAQVSTIASRLQEAGVLLDIDATSGESTALREYVAAALRQSGGQVVSTRSLPRDGDREIARRALALTLNAKISELETLLYALETHTPFLFVEKLQIQAQGGRRARAAQNDVLRVQMTIVGYGGLG